MGRIKRIWYLSPVKAAKVQASLRICAVSPEPPLLAHTNSESRGTFRQKARSLAPLNGWACAVKNCHDGMLEDTNSPDTAHMWTVVVTTMYISFRPVMWHGFSVCTLICYQKMRLFSHAHSEKCMKFPYTFHVKFHLALIFFFQSHTDF